MVPTKNLGTKLTFPKAYSFAESFISKLYHSLEILIIELGRSHVRGDLVQEMFCVTVEHFLSTSDRCCVTYFVNQLGSESFLTNYFSIFYRRISIRRKSLRRNSYEEKKQRHLSINESIAMESRRNRQRMINMTNIR